MLLTNADLGDIQLLQVVPSFRCSRGCHYCYNTHLQQVSAQSATGGDHEPILAFLEANLRHMPRLREIEIIGGEPLEGPARALSLAILQRSKRLRPDVTLTLNTAFQSSALLSEVSAHLDHLFLSVDASRSLLNRKRLRPAEMRKIVELSTRDQFELQISCVLFGQDSPEGVARFVHELAELGVTSVGFGHEVVADHDREVRSRISDVYYELFKLRLSLHGQIAVGGAVLDSLELAVSGASRHAGCGCGTQVLVLEPDGRLAPGVFFDHGARLQMDHADFVALTEARTRNLIAREPCRSCDLWAVCGGGCIGIAAVPPGEPLERDTVQCGHLLDVWDAVCRDLGQRGEGRRTPRAVDAS